MFRALQIRQDSVGDWWLDVEAADGWPPRLANVPHHCSTINEMPLEVREKLACLRMADIGTVIAGVGRRVAEKSFWVYMFDEPRPKIRSLQ